MELILDKKIKINGISIGEPRGLLYIDPASTANKRSVVCEFGFKAVYTFLSCPKGEKSIATPSKTAR